MGIWLVIIINIIASVLSVMIINRGITETGQNDIVLGLVLLIVNMGCLAFNIYRKENDV